MFWVAPVLTNKLERDPGELPERKDAAFVAETLAGSGILFCKKKTEFESGEVTNTYGSLPFTEAAAEATLKAPAIVKDVLLPPSSCRAELPGPVVTNVPN